MKVYGIKNCNSVQKALNYLQQHGIDFEFHDFKKSGVTLEKLEEWVEKLGWESLVNKKGTTWRKLDPEIQATVSNRQGAIELMREKTSVIKRPILEYEGKVLLGFDENQYSNLLK